MGSHLYDLLVSNHQMYSLQLSHFLQCGVKM